MENINIPKWINQDLSPSDIAAINQGGCASGAYMPAVEYYNARKVMNEYGDDVLAYIIDHNGELPEHDKDSDWSQLAVFFLSYAVEMFCIHHDYLADWENEKPIAA